MQWELGTKTKLVTRRERGGCGAEHPANLKSDRGHRVEMPKDRYSRFGDRAVTWPIEAPTQRPSAGSTIAAAPAFPRRISSLFNSALLASILLTAGCGSLLPAGIFAEGKGFTGTTAPTEEQLKMTAQAQKVLTELGYQPGEADGLDGPKTRDAIRQFQADADMPQDGQVSPTLLKHLAIAIDGGTGGTGGVASTEPPAYELGSTFVFSNGSVETVIGLDGQKIRWRTNRGETFTADRNFVVPRLSWYSDGRRGERLIQGRPEAIWPLRVDQKVSFTTRTTVRGKDGLESVKKTDETWDCNTEGMARISVVAGVFSTVKVSCERKINDRSPLLTRIWYYAPSIGHVVRMNDLYNIVESDKHVELVSIRPGAPDWPPAARAGLGWALEDALESLQDGAVTQWSSSGVDVRVNIKLGKRFERGDGKQCRTFMQTWLTTGPRRSYPGIGCRNGLGRWQIPGLENSKDGSIAVSDGVS